MSTNDFDAQQDDLHRAMFGGPAPTETTKPERVRAGEGLDFAEVTAKYPNKASRDELAMALRLEHAGSGVQLSDEERPFAEAIVAAEDHSAALAELATDLHR